MPLSENQQDALFILLKTAHHFCLKKKLKPILTGSALVGLYRDKKLINCEAIFNIDHATIKNKYLVLSALLTKSGYTTRLFSRSGKEKLSITDKKNGVRVQLLSFHKMKKYYYRKKGKHEARCILPHFYENLGIISYRDYNFTCPRDIEKYLAYIYLNWKKPHDIPAIYFRHDQIRSPEYMGLQFGYKKWRETYYENNKRNRELLEKSRQKKSTD